MTKAKKPAPTPDANQIAHRLVTQATGTRAGRGKGAPATNKRKTRAT
ncbi:MAG: hypothetical protein JSS51_04235 [Planctomycetes bacterium]|nr:hypothetical protein [Planctomycetota bacterium]